MRARTAIIATATAGGLVLMSLGGQADTLPRYTVESSGGENTVVDGVTGLTWQQQSSTLDPLNWMSALRHCEELDYAGQTDWRLPNVTELLSIVDEKRTAAPAINLDFFTGFNAFAGFWTSTSSRTNASAAYVVHFEGGTSEYNQGGTNTISKAEDDLMIEGLSRDDPAVTAGEQSNLASGDSGGPVYYKDQIVGVMTSSFASLGWIVDLSQKENAEFIAGVLAAPTGAP